MEIGGNARRDGRSRPALGSFGRDRLWIVGAVGVSVLVVGEEGRKRIGLGAVIVGVHVIGRGEAQRFGEPAAVGEKAFGHVGAGGHIGFADPECGLAFSYTMSQMGKSLLMNERGQSLIDATYRALGYRSNAPGAWVR